LQIKYRNIDIHKIKIFVLLIIIIVISDDSLWFGTNKDQRFITLKYAILILTTFFIWIKHIKSLTLRVSYASCLCAIMCCFVIVCAFVNNDIRVGYFYKCILLFLAYEFTSTIRLDEMGQLYEKILLLFTTISLFGMLLVVVARPFLSILPIFVNSANSTFYNGFLFMIYIGNNIYRDYGIFREPGVFQIYIIIAFIFHIYYSNPVKISHIIIYVLGVLLTFSTTGYIALVPVLILYFINDNKRVNNKKKIIVEILLIFGLIYLATQTTLLSGNGVVFDKFENTKRYTTIARFASMTSNFEIWLNHPFFGAGLDNVSKLFPILTGIKYGFASEHNTNTFMNELATYGIFYTSIFIYGYIKFSEKIANSRIEQILIIFTFILLFCGERLTFSPIVYILLFYGLKKEVPSYE